MNTPASPWPLGMNLCHEKQKKPLITSLQPGGQPGFFYDKLNKNYLMRFNQGGESNACKT
jgi:hypothetical protein